MNRHDGEGYSSRRLSALLAALVLLACLAGPSTLFGGNVAAATRTLYVDPVGSDTSGTGSAAKPWKTIGKAVDEAVAGDLVLINAGTYAETITIEEKHGTAAAPIVLRANGNVVIDGTASSRDAVFVTYSSYVVIEGWTVQNAPRAGLRIDASQHITVRNGTFANNGRWGIFTDFSDDLLIEYNEAYGSKLEHGIYHSNSGDRPTIRGNVIHGNYAAGLHMNADLSMGGDGIISGALVEGNVIYDNGTGGGAAINMDGITDSIVRNNLLYNNRASGIAIYQIDGAVCSQNNQYLNNTIVMPSNGRWAVTIPSAGCVNNKFFNNIFHNDHSFRGAISLGAWPISGFQSDYNVVMDRFTTTDGDSRLTLAQWQTLGNDAHSRIATPAQLFVDSGSDFHLKSGSPAIDAGRTLSNVTVDLDGNSRPRGNGYDAGAYESGSSASTATPTKTPSPSATATASATPSATVTKTPASTPTNTPVATSTATATKTATATATRTPTKTATPKPTATPTKTPTPTATPVVKPSCTDSPKEGRVGTKLTASCKGFLSGEQITFFWDSVKNEPIANGDAGAKGTVELIVRVPESAGGRHSLVAWGESSRKRVSISVTVQPRIALGTVSGAAGGKIVVDLTGFRAGETVSIRWYETSTKYRTIKTSIKIGASGRASFMISVPETTSTGAHKVEARGNSGSRAGTTYTVTSVKAVSVEPTATPKPARAMPTAAPPTATAVPEVTAEPTPET